MKSTFATFLSLFTIQFFGCLQHTSSVLFTVAIPHVIHAVLPAYFFIDLLYHLIEDRFDVVT